MSDLSDPHVRAYLMAYAAVETFGFTSENKNDYAARLSRVGVERGLEAEAEAIARDCEAHGLQMSPGRVLKALAEFQERHASRVHFVPEQRTLIVADGYAPGDYPYARVERSPDPPARVDPARYGRAWTDQERDVPLRSRPQTRSPAGTGAGFIAGAIATVVAITQADVRGWLAIGLGAAVWIVVSLVWKSASEGAQDES